MEETAANRRLRAIQDHISASSAAAAGLIEANATAGEFVSGGWWHRRYYTITSINKWN
ncbi:hypothetical protein QJS10_CPA05g00848 [Acorus calamus]|uniref:Uncharacterized protein n=1 Tax=Acorus calamus TaxID=4465 RepID=A0AAV9EUA4_ACOCL|nr:hypothetical protein QJS10_CPA05g00848 [Acorus calamus]